MNNNSTEEIKPMLIKFGRESLLNGYLDVLRGPACPINANNETWRKPSSKRFKQILSGIAFGIFSLTSIFYTPIKQIAKHFYYDAARPIIRSAARADAINREIEACNKLKNFGSTMSLDKCRNIEFGKESNKNDSSDEDSILDLIIFQLRFILNLFLAKSDTVKFA